MIDMTQDDLNTSWADMVLKIWIERISALDISNASVHASSLFYTCVSAANGDSTKINFIFEYILKFTDMGVGKGVSFSNRGQIGSRRQKQWFTKTFLLEVKKFANMRAQLFGLEAVLFIREVINDNK
jgi:hypothetical protein